MTRSNYLTWLHSLSVIWYFKTISLRIHRYVIKRTFMKVKSLGNKNVILNGSSFVKWVIQSRDTIHSRAFLSFYILLIFQQHQNAHKCKARSNLLSKPLDRLKVHWKVERKLQNANFIFSESLVIVSTQFQPVVSKACKGRSLPNFLYWRQEWAWEKVSPANSCILAVFSHHFWPFFVEKAWIHENIRRQRKFTIGSRSLIMKVYIPGL